MSEALSIPLLDEDHEVPEGSSTGRSSASSHREMTEIASDHHSDSLMKRLSDYEVLTDPPSRFRKDKYARKDTRKKRDTWAGTRPASEVPLTLSPTHNTTYQAVINEGAEDIIQAQYEREGYNMTFNSSIRYNEDENMTINVDDRSASISMREEDDFISIYLTEDVNTDETMSITQAINTCNKYVLRPFNVFLKIIGWRALHSQQTVGTPWHKKCFNITYPSFIFVMLIITSLAQIFSCFSRTESTPPPCKAINSTLSISHIVGNCSEYYILDCSKGVVTGTVLSDFLLVVSYVWALIFFRFSEKEHLSKLMHTVFLSCNSKLVRYSTKRLVRMLLFFLLMGLLWVVFSTFTSVLRLFALRLVSSNLVNGWFYNETAKTLLVTNSTYHVVQYLITSISFVSFIFFDMLYVAVVINYITQCQLLHFYIRNIKEKVKTKAYLLGHAVKELYHVNEYLRVLNGNLSHVTGLVLFIFIQGIVLAYRDFLNVEIGQDPLNYVNVIVGILNLIQWLVPTLALVLQCARLNAECNGIRKLGLEIGARPFVYSDTPQLVLDSFLLYTTSTKYNARIAFIPLYPSFVFGFLFVLGLFLTLNPSWNTFLFAPWF